MARPALTTFTFHVAIFLLRALCSSHGCVLTLLLSRHSFPPGLCSNGPGLGTLALRSTCTWCVFRISPSRHRLVTQHSATALPRYGSALWLHTFRLLSRPLWRGHWHRSPAPSSVCQNHCLSCCVAPLLCISLHSLYYFVNMRGKQKELNLVRGSINLKIQPNWNENEVIRHAKSSVSELLPGDGVSTRGGRE